MATTRAARAPVAATRRKQDVLGLCLFFAGAALLLSLVFHQSAPVPDASTVMLRLIAGGGAFGLPVALMFMGAMFLLGYERLALTHSSYGTLLLFLAYVTWRHIAFAHAEGDPFALPERLATAGGYTGAVIGTIFTSLLGHTWSYLALGLMVCVAVVLLVERPFLDTVHQVTGRPAKAGLAVARNGVRAVTGKRTEPGDDLRRLPSASGEPARHGLLDRFRGARGTDDSADEPLAVVRGMEQEFMLPVGGAATRRRRTPESPDQTRFPTLDTESQSGLAFKLPGLDLLNSAPAPPRKSQQELTEKIRVLEQTLEHFKITANVVEVAHGPTVTRYEIQLAPGIKVSKIVSLADNLAMALAAIDVRVEAPIPGKSAIGVEVPNAVPALVTLRDCLDVPEFWTAPSKLTFALGKDVAGTNRYADLARMPHLLVAGSTNSGKSVCLNAIIASLVYRATPSELKLLMIDPKRVELSLWQGIPHLMHPVVTDVKQAPALFRAAIKEMERRYGLFSQLHTRNLEGYNQRVAAEDRLPFIVLVVDELADLMMQYGAEIEQSICRIAQLARATGIHLVIATQRPSVDVITGLIKANISSRVAFAVSSQIDSRTILDMGGAERLIGRGDMLFLAIDAPKPMRIQGAYLSEEETNKLVEYLKQQDTPEYSIALSEPGDDTDMRGASSDVEDELYESAVRLVVGNSQASTSMIQRRFKIGYTRAARLVDMMYDRGLVGPPDGARPREVLVTRDQVDQMFRPGDDNYVG